ncbi:MAG TPA: SprT family zinc-dependent metalloprotease [Alcanivoracaceae bacterium]|nr:SprT family zinc-dependent metalloprotease [Alcanivoracaceae bacterium]
MEHYRLIRTQRKTLALQVSVEGELIVRAPKNLPRARVEAFVAEKKSWIKRARQRLAARKKPLPLTLEEGESVPFLGTALTLRLKEEISDGQREGDTLFLPKGDVNLRKQALIAWYKRMAQPLFETVIDEHFPYFAERGYSRPTLYIKNMKTRWGSLSTKGNMSLNVALMQLPPECLHSVVVHELCHLVHMNHSSAFYALLSERYPRWRESDELIKKTPILPLAG